MNINFNYQSGKANQIDFWHDRKLLNNIPNILNEIQPSGMMQNIIYQKEQDHI